VLWIQDVYPVSEFFLSHIPDSGSKRHWDPGSRIRICIKELKYFKAKRLLISSGHLADPVSSVLIPELDFVQLQYKPFPDPRVKKALDPRSATLSVVRRGNVLVSSSGSHTHTV
jgi:hypothetical protein